MAVSRTDFVCLAETSAIIQESEDLVKSSKASVYVSLKRTEEIKEIGGNTLTKLYHQGEQLDKIDENVDKIEDDIKEGKRQIRSIKSFFGAVRNKFFKRSTKPVKAKKIRVLTNNVTIPENQKKNKLDSSMFSHLSTEAQQDIEEIDDHLDQIEKNLDVIHNISKEMGREIDNHNEKKIKRLNQKIHTNNQELKNLSKSIL